MLQHEKLSWIPLFSSHNSKFTYSTSCVYQISPRKKITKSGLKNIY